MSSVVSLTCAVQKYPWGKPGSRSLVAALTGNQEDTKTPYAELWMGTHPKAPSSLTESGQALSAWLAADSPNRLGALAGEMSGHKDSLPFLLKVLSVNKALSIQAHPTKEHAARLHAADPTNYPDPNHKPEMAIALTRFQGLCGFRRELDIMTDLVRFTDLHPLLRQETVDGIFGKKSRSPTFLRDLFSEIISLDGGVKIVHDFLSALPYPNPTDHLFLRIHQQHPGDPGLLCIYLLNHVTLAPGEAMFLGPNNIHAYFSGDCVECMACSDNVVRAGLTGKFKDESTLVEMLDYTPTTAADQVMKSESGEGGVVQYRPPVPDFAVDKLEGEGRFVARSSPMVVLCTEGEGEMVVGEERVEVRKGSVVYLVPGVEARVSGAATLFAAYCQEGTA